MVTHSTLEDMLEEGMTYLVCNTLYLRRSNFCNKLTNYGCYTESDLQNVYFNLIPLQKTVYCFANSKLFAFLLTTLRTCSIQRRPRTSFGWQTIHIAVVWQWSWFPGSRNFGNSCQRRFLFQRSSHSSESK